LEEFAFVSSREDVSIIIIDRNQPTVAAIREARVPQAPSLDLKFFKKLT
jgi:hypothetical protein